MDPPLPEHSEIEPHRLMAARQPNSLKGLSFKRLCSDRDISPEPDSTDLKIAFNGVGVTTAIRHFLTKASRPDALVEDTLLTELNRIFEPDARFKDITVKQDDDGRWEVYLGEEAKGRIPLSQSGSGLKTVLLVLAFLYLIPAIEGKEAGNYIFAFEELENNLHPSLQRRLFAYVRDFAVEHGCPMLITTHSNVAIDLFSADEAAQIVHVQHDGEQATACTVRAYGQRCGILDDLDVRASDLLQANGVVWVEGPSDRLYFNRWVALWSDGQLKEGVHYQCVFYGGRLLAHLSAEDPELDAGDLVHILRLNRNAILLMDSDRRKKGGGLNASKQRMISEVEGVGGLAWVTAGREVENYIPRQALAGYYGADGAKAPGPYQPFPRFLDGLKPGEGKRFTANKVAFADRICPLLTRESIAAALDLGERLDEVCRCIREWNGM
jgi:putative ATP-dependent endonuclease of OLD family